LGFIGGEIHRDLKLKEEREEREERKER